MGLGSNRNAHIIKKSFMSVKIQKVLNYITEDEQWFGGPKPIIWEKTDSLGKPAWR